MQATTAPSFSASVARAFLVLGAGTWAAAALDAPGGAAPGASRASAQAAASAPSATPAERVVVEGFATPESALLDEVAGVVLVSNVAGDPLAKDGSGFVSRVSPEGEVLALRWIEGGKDGVELHAPKGLALHGDLLYVADVDVVRAFDRGTGAPRGATPIPGATFLNDLAVAEDGTVYVSDTGTEDPATGAVWRFRDGAPELVVRGAALERPNGLLLADDDRALLVAPFGGRTLKRLRLDTEEVGVDDVATLPRGALDGLALAGDQVLVSSWDASAVYALPPSVLLDGSAPAEATVVLSDLDAPADLGWDAARERVLVPLFRENRLLMTPLENP